LVRLAENPGESAIDDILAHAKERLADYKVPEWLEVVDEIPRNTLGKIGRKSLPAMTADRKRRRTLSGRAAISSTSAP
jgi:acyl-CoA synthetase (AMP-forming)/AMP-acid ligase II